VKIRKHEKRGNVRDRRSFDSRGEVMRNERRLEILSFEDTDKRRTVQHITIEE